MINLGPYSGKNCPNVRFHPTLLDRMLEGVAMLVFLLTWGGIYVLYTYERDLLPSDVWTMGGGLVLTFLLLGIAGYLPVRFFSFPVRITERNVAVQYLLAVRFTRVLNILVSLMFSAAVFREYFAWGDVLAFALLVLLGLAFLVFFVLAFKYK